MKVSNVDKLSSYVEALRPIIYINHFDFEAVDRLIEEAADGAAIHEYNNAGGWVSFKGKHTKNDIELFPFLAQFDTDIPQPTNFIVLKDIHNHFENPKVLASLKSIAFKRMYQENYETTIFIVSTKLVIPVELEKLITLFDIPYPDTNEISEIIKGHAESFGITMTKEVLDELVVSFRGLSAFEIEQILNLAYQESGEIDEKDKELILKEKEQNVRKSGMLEIVNVKESFKEIGGLENMKQYLEKKAVVFNRLSEAREFGIDLPRGLLIIGMPGCGKSLTAKVTSKMFGAPLLRLDVGKLMGRYVGESEDNLRRAIKTAEAVAPCVLWIDELEKAFAGVGGSGGGSDVTTRLFGNFLTWLQEKESSVYVVATSNDISKLPPEFLRKGRFDELFLVDLPNDEERKNIFEIHLKKRKKFTRDVNSIKLIKETKGFSGADIESVVKETIEKAFVSDDKRVTTERLLDIIKATKSISVTLKEKIDELKKVHDKFDMKLATNPM